MVRDPVCGMYLDSDRSSERTLYEGKPYHFCCEGCRRLFEAQPQAYLGEARGGGASDKAVRLAGDALEDLSPQARVLASRCLACPGACEALEQFYLQGRTAMTLEDWAYLLGKPAEEIAKLLITLEEWALVERLPGGALSFYRLTRLKEARRTLEEFLLWRRKLALQLTTLGEMLKIELGKEEPWFAIRSVK